MATHNIDGIGKVSDETIKAALKAYVVERPEKKKKEVRSFEPIKVDFFTVGLDGGGDVYVKISPNHRIKNYAITKSEIGCWLNSNETDNLIDAIQQAQKFANEYM